MGSNQTTKQGIVTSQATFNEHQTVESFALFHADGTPVSYPKKASDLAHTVITTGSAIGTQGKSTASAEPPANTLVPIKFTNGNSADQPTIAFNGGTPRQIKLGGTRSATAKLVVAADGVALFFFDGTVLHQVGTYT